MGWNRYSQNGIWHQWTKYICMPKTQYMSYNFDIATLIVFFSGSKILYLIKTVSKAIINNGVFKIAVLTQL